MFSKCCVIYIVFKQIMPYFNDNILSNDNKSLVQWFDESNINLYKIYIIQNIVIDRKSHCIHLQIAQKNDL